MLRASDMASAMAMVRIPPITIARECVPECRPTIRPSLVMTPEVNPKLIPRFPECFHSASSALISAGRSAHRGWLCLRVLISRHP
jgi:hypothetical protein